ncbi:MAG: hypothetical protein C4589_06255 [Peptococcaceae bacterium]|nr:MAG: hypothetical protein C4589_06255 [Peptococcaceae bacterium]
MTNWLTASLKTFSYKYIDVKNGLQVPFMLKFFWKNVRLLLKSIFKLVCEQERSEVNMPIILITFLFAVILLISGFVKKNRFLKMASVALFIISTALSVIIWNALSHM